MKKSMSFRGLTIVLSVLLVGTLVFPYAHINGQEDPCEGKPKAYILVGDISGPGPVETAYKNAAYEANMDFAIAGYDTVLNMHATAQDVQDALDDPCVKAIMIIGHGGGEVYKTIGGKKLYNPLESIAMINDEWITGDPNMTVQGDLLLNASSSSVKAVYLHSCNQDLPSWRALFPNTEFYAWRTRAYYWATFWWQWFHRPTSAELIGQVTSNASIPKLTGEQTAMLASDLIEYTRPDAPGIIAVVPQYMLWSPPSEYALAVSDLSVNFYAISDDGMDQLHLFGLTTLDDEMSYVDTVLTDPTAEITIRNSGLWSILENPSRFAFALHTGDITAAGDYTLTELEMTILGAMVFGPEVMEPRVRLIDVFNPSSLLARTGLITASLTSTGAASGLIARLSLTSHLGVPITLDIGNSGLEGMVLVNPNQNEQDEIITRIPGVFLSPTYRPTSEVTINPGENVTLPVIGYCINYDKDNPSDGTEFSLDSVSKKTDITSILEILDILENTTFPVDLTDDQILHIKQLAIWSILPENSEVTLEGYAERGYSIPDESIQIIKDIYAQAQLHDAGDAYIFQEGEASFSLDDVILDPSSLAEGETVTITGKITNTGTISGSKTISLKVDNDIIDERTVTLGPGESTTITFEVAAAGEGEHIVIIDGYTGSYTVKKASIMDQIPGFPHESIIIGLIISIITIWVLRAQKYS